EITTGVGAGTCQETSPQTGYWTQYVYDPRGLLAEVVQNAQSSASQTRHYTYDGLGRLTSENNPESGLTQYFYDTESSGKCLSGWPSSSGDLITKLDANGNATCYQYDALHRVASVNFYGPNVAPSRHFVYDADSVNGTSMANVKGRLAGAFTCTAGVSTC